MLPWTYVLSAETASNVVSVKIGKAINVRERLKTLQTGNADRLHFYGATQDLAERDVHARYAQYRRDPTHEWFDLPLHIFVDFIRMTMSPSEYDEEMEVIEDEVAIARAQRKELSKSQIELDDVKDELTCAATVKSGLSVGKRCTAGALIRGGYCGKHVGASSLVFFDDPTTRSQPVSSLTPKLTDQEYSFSVECGLSEYVVALSQITEHDPKYDEHPDQSTIAPAYNAFVQSTSRYINAIKWAFKVRDLSQLFQHDPPSERWKTYDDALSAISVDHKFTVTLMAMLYAKDAIIYCGDVPHNVTAELVQAVISNPLIYLTLNPIINKTLDRRPHWIDHPKWKELTNCQNPDEIWYRADTVRLVVGSSNVERVRALIKESAVKIRSWNEIGEYTDKLCKAYQADRVCTQLMNAYLATLKKHITSRATTSLSQN